MPAPTKFNSSAIDFCSWLLPENGPSPSKSAIENCLKILFLSTGALGSAYRSTAKRGSAAIDEISNSLSRKRCTLIAGAIQQLAPLGDRIGFPISAQRLIDFLLDQRVMVHAKRDVLGTGVVSWNHGDLHSRNILVDIERESPIIIDPAQIDWGSLGLDMARLLVDLLLRSLAVDGSEHFWDDFSSWDEKGKRVLEASTISNADALTPANGGSLSGIDFALNWMASNRKDVLQNEIEEIPDWQWQLLLAVELLRQSSFLHLSAPKRVVSLVFAERMLTSAAESIPTDSLR